MKNDKNVDRREFIKAASMTGFCMLAMGCDKNSLSNDDTSPPPPPDPPPKTDVALVKTSNRAEGVRKIVELLGYGDVTGNNAVIKPNWNTSDICPGSTHNDTLIEIVESLKDDGAATVTVAERSYQEFNSLLDQKGLKDLANQHGFTIVDLEHDSKTHTIPRSSHWNDGFYFPDTIKNAEYLVSTCCLKTHAYGGHFTMSLKLSVGCLPRQHMGELHSSQYMRDLITEINLAYSPDIVIMDAVDCFIDGGPATGTVASPGVFIGSKDRVAVDAVGVAILKDMGSNNFPGAIFDQDQLRRAVELNMGIAGPGEINWVTDDEDSRQYTGVLQGILESS